MAFWTVYRLFLSNETFHAFNRWFLLAGLPLSFVLPLFQFYYPKTIIATPIEFPGRIFTVIDGAAPLPEAPALGWLHIAVAVYAAVALSQLARSLMEVRRINRLIAKYGYTQHSGYRLVELDLPIAPFSFRNYIFINRDKITGMEAGVIIAHESSHIRQRHWMDLIAGTALRIVQWINPFAFLLVRGMRENHEFMADKAVLDGGNSAAVYKAVLINCSLGGRVFTLGHPFSGSNNLKRHKMMNKKLSSASRKWSVLTILPLAALFFMAFAKPRYTIIETAAAPAAQEIVGVIGGITPAQAAADEPPTIPVRASASDSITVKFDGSDTLIELHGQTQAGSIGTRKVFTIDTEADSMGIAKKYSRSLTVHNPPLGADSVRKNVVIGYTIREAGDSISPPLFIVDGFEKSYEFVHNLNTDRIKSITVLKDEKSTALYGAQGKNGVVIVETIAVNRKVDDISGSKGVAFMSGGTGKMIGKDAPEPLVIVDGHRVSVAIMNSLSDDRIESISVLKNESALEQYGEDGRNGVIVIELKKE